MPVQIEFVIEGEKQISAVLGIAADGVKTYRRPMSEIGGELQKTWQTNFSGRGSRLQAPGWPPRKSGGDWPLLEKTGRMRASFKDVAHDDYVELTNTAPYFPYHQSNAPRSRLPRRIMMKIDEQDRNFIFKTLQRYITEVTRGQRQQ